MTCVCRCGKSAARINKGGFATCPVCNITRRYIYADNKTPAECIMYDKPSNIFKRLFKRQCIHFGVNVCFKCGESISHPVRNGERE